MKIRTMAFPALLAWMSLSGCGQREDHAQLDDFRGGRSNLGLKTIDAEARTFEKNINGENVKVVLIDMIHVAPARFYKEVGQVIGQHYQQDADMRILLEGYRDTREKRFKINFVRLKAAGFPTSLQAWQALEAQDIERWIKIGALELVDAADAPKFNPYDLLSKISLLAPQDNRSFVPNEEVAVNADIDGKDLSMKDQVAMDFLFSCMQNPLGCVGTGALPAFQEAFMQVIRDKRNEHLLKRVDEMAQQGTRTMVAPWGSAHMPGLYEGLKAQGFKQTQVEPIMLISCVRAAFSLAMRMTLYGPICKGQPAGQQP